MNIAVIGSGAREHALVQSITEGNQGNQVTCCGSFRNPGIEQLTSAYGIADITQPEQILTMLESWGTDFAVIGPEAPLEAGAADYLRDAGIAVFGPDRQLAQIETSKSFARSLIAKTVPEANPSCTTVASQPEAEEILRQLGDAYVVKADGLAGGKGVKVSGEHLHSHQQATEYISQLLNAAGSCLLEEKLIGQEFSLFTVTDGKTVVHLPPVQDHKRAYEGDTGPNTGGMGSYTDANWKLPFLSDEDIHSAERYNEQIIEALGRECNAPYRGVLYGGFMAVRAGVKIIEYNARFGDPEVMNLMSILDTEAAELLYAAATGTLSTVQTRYKPQASVCKYAVPHGYPDTKRSGEELTISTLPSGVRLYMGSLEKRDGRLATLGSRTLACTAAAPTIEQAHQQVEKALEAVKGNLFHRRDIGTSSLVAQRVSFMQELRS
ncbi:MAG: phosphoribosylamine--glycine ligase [Spirochaetota bacterium]